MTYIESYIQFLNISIETRPGLALDCHWLLKEPAFICGKMKHKQRREKKGEPSRGRNLDIGQDPNSEKGFDSESIASRSTWAKLKREIHLLKNEQKKREEQAQKNHCKTVKSLCSCVFFIIAGFTIFTLIIVLDAKNAGNQSFITKSFLFYTYSVSNSY